ncbi:LuxR family transcriptional regulator [Bradyrhizobium liaoningense]|nr:LuxR family transcriptional regulator [Bradyrhizobium liaoningense]
MDRRSRVRRNAFRFADEVQRISDPAKVMEAMIKAVGLHGFDNFCASFVTLAPGEGTQDLILADKFPDGWVKHYIERDFVHADPAVRHTKRTIRPYRWVADAPYDPRREPHFVEMVQRARDWGLQDGLVIPAHSSNGRIGQVWFGGRESEIDLPMDEFPALHFMALYAFERVLELSGRTDLPQPALTPREREVLTLAAVGKTGGEISEMLHISLRTVAEHIKNACHKLGAATRTHAVVLAMKNGIIQP